LTRRNTQYLDVSLNPNFSLTCAYAHPAEEEEEEKVVAVEKADADGETERVNEEKREEVKMQGRRGRETQREIERETGGNRWREKERREKERRVLSGLSTLISGSQGSAQVVKPTYTNSLRPHTVEGRVH